MYCGSAAVCRSSHGLQSRAAAGDGSRCWFWVSDIYLSNAITRLPPAESPDMAIRDAGMPRWRR